MVIGGLELQIRRYTRGKDEVANLLKNAQTLPNQNVHSFHRKIHIYKSMMKFIYVLFFF